MILQLTIVLALSRMRRRVAPHFFASIVSSTMAMNLSENTKKADSAEDESWAEEHPEELLHAAIKLKRRGMIVHEVASLCYDSTTCECYAVKDEDGICSALSYDIETNAIIKSTTFEWTDKVDFTHKLVECLGYLDSSAWVIVLEDGYLNKEWIAIEVLVPLIEKGFKELGRSDDAIEWLKLRLE